MIMIRPLQKDDDLKDLIALSREFFKEYESHHSDFFEIDKLLDRDVIDYFSRWLADDDGETFIALDGDKIVGYITVYAHDQASYWQVRRVGHISGLMVHRPYRQQGIASQLLAKAKEFLIEKEVWHITVFTAVENQVGINFYQQNGLVPLYTTFLGTIDPNTSQP